MKTGLNNSLKKTFFIAVVLMALSAACAGNQISMQSEVDRNVITIGDYIDYRIVMDYDPDINVEMPGLGINLGMFEIKDYNVKPDQVKDGRINREIIYKISTYTTGEYTIPGITVEYTVQDKRERIVSNPIKIEVKSVTKGEELSDIKDVKELYIPQINYRKLMIIVSVGILVLIIGVLAYVFGVKKKSGGVEYEEVITDYYEEYLDRLSRIEKDCENADLKETYFLMDDVFRKYFSMFIHEDLMELTTYEIIKKFSRKLPERIERPDFTSIKNFMEHADYVKFAKLPVTFDEAISDIRFIRTFMQDHRVEPVREFRVAGGRKR